MRRPALWAALLLAAAAARGAAAARAAPQQASLPPPLANSTAFRPSALSEPRAGAQISVGTEAAPGQFPWAVAISFAASLPPQCTGTLISPTAVLTAAHCVAAYPGYSDGVPAANLLVRIGGVDWRCADGAGCDVRRVARVVAHPEFVSTFRADVAVLILAQPSTQRPARMAAAAAPIGSLAELAGWGAVEPSAAQPDPPNPVRLRRTSVLVRPPKCCRNRDGDTVEYCTGSAGANSATGFASDSCAGDSGGPMMLAGTDILAGVISSGVYDEKNPNQGVCGKSDGSLEVSAAWSRAWVASVVPDLPPAPAPGEYPAPLLVSGNECYGQAIRAPTPPLSPPPSPAPSPPPSPAPSQAPSAPPSFPSTPVPSPGRLQGTGLCGGRITTSSWVNDEVKRVSWTSPSSARRVSFSVCRQMCDFGLQRPCFHWSWTEGSAGGACVLHGALATVKRASPGIETHSGSCYP
jgi:hypothetical protein